MLQVYAFAWMFVFIEIACVDDQDYAWIKHGMIFPFVDYVDRYLLLAFANYDL